MDLTHQFTVPTPVEETWAHFQDIASLAQCFPGAQVNATSGDTFEGTCKVKLGPIALVYAGSGSFVERDEAAHRFVVEAKGRDKRGNGTAGATVTLSMAESEEADAGTDVQVVTDLSITGKPAQFGRGVMQDVSDKLLGQFVTCLEQRLGGSEGTAADAAGAAASSADPGPAATGAEASVAPDQPDAGPAATSTPPTPIRPTFEEEDDALDLGAAVLPVLLKAYGKQVAIGVLAFLGLVVIIRRLTR